MNQFRTLNIDVVINGKTVRIDGYERTYFIKRYELDIIIPNRYSEILIADLIINFEWNGIDPRQVINEIKRLENISDDGYTKKATQFKHDPLHPLWHQHYFSSHYIVPNIQNEINKNFKNIWDKSMGVENSIIEQKHINKLVDNMVNGTIEKRINEKKITGEWLIFSKEKTGNIYLCMATHTNTKTEDQEIYNKLDYCCQYQFPLLEPFASNRKKL
jgi:hypothetical protein